MVVVIVELGGHFEVSSGLDHSSDVEIEEVGVENSLDDSGDNGDHIKEVLVVVTVDPVDDVKSTISSEGEEIMGSDCLGVSSLGEHEELRHNSYGLEIDGECPHDLHESEFVIDEKSKKSTRNYENLHAEHVVVSVVGCLELMPHEIDNSES